MSSYDTAPLNNQPYHEINQPRMLALIDGQWLVVPQSYEITFAIHGAADTATVVVTNATGIESWPNAPDWTQALYRGANASNSNEPVYIQIFSGLLPPGVQPSISNLTLKFWGVVDQYTVEPGVTNDWTTFSCRSLAAPLIDNKVVVPLAQNYTTNQFVQYCATAFNMPAPVINLTQGTGVTMQQVLAQELIAGLHSFSYWELLVRASLQDDADIWVDPIGAIHYESRMRNTRPNILMKWGRDLTSFKGTHSPQFSRNVQVDIKIYNPQTKTATVSRAILGGPDGQSLELLQGSRVVTTTPLFGTLSTVTNTISNPFSGSPFGTSTTTTSTKSPLGGAFNASAEEGKAAGDTGKERYVLWLKGGISPSQALTQARQMFLEISQHEYQAHVVVPITEALLLQFVPLAQNTSIIDVNITLQGLPYKYFNGPYWPRQVIEHCSIESGYFWEIDAVNHAPPAAIG